MNINKFVSGSPFCNKMGIFGLCRVNTATVTEAIDLQIHISVCASSVNCYMDPDGYSVTPGSITYLTYDSSAPVLVR